MNILQGLTNKTEESRILRHVIFWSVFFLLDVLKYHLIKPSGFLETLVYNLCAIIPQIGFAYLLGYAILPLFTRNRTRIVSVLLFLLGSYVLAALNRTLIVHVGEELMRIRPFEQESIYEIFTDWKSLLGRYLPSTWGVGLVFVSVKYFMEREKNYKDALNFEKQKVQSELNTLKAQLNPHFLFNSLNNLYSLSIIQSPSTSDAIGKLSDMLDHILYRCNSTTVPLKKELELIHNYIELEQLRYDDRLELNFDKDIKSEIEIPPLVLLSLVENAFKHGAAEDDGRPDIDISVNSDEKVFLFKISNSIATLQAKSEKPPIGLKNIRQQLELLYGEAYELIIEKSNSRYTVVLRISQSL